MTSKVLITYPETLDFPSTTNLRLNLTGHYHGSQTKPIRARVGWIDYAQVIDMILTTALTGGAATATDFFNVIGNRARLFETNADRPYN